MLWSTDDETPLLELEREPLWRICCRVTGSTGSIEALAVFSKDPMAFGLLITDMSRPNITGAELSRQILEIRPDLPIILFTGFSETMDEQDAKAIGVCEYALKP